MEPFQSSALGNCHWCSLSIVLEGDEHCQNQLRLGAVVATLRNMKAFTKDVGALAKWYLVDCTIPMAISLSTTKKNGSLI